MLFWSLFVIVAGILVIEQLVVIVLLAVMNSNLKKNQSYIQKTGFSVPDQQPVHVLDSNGSKRKGIMMCRKCYQPVNLGSGICTCCGQKLVMR